MKLKLFFLLTGLVILVSCKEDCWDCYKKDTRSGYFFKNSDTIQYYFRGDYDRYIQYKDSLNSIGYSEYKLQSQPMSIAEVCGYDRKTTYYIRGYLCTKIN